MPIAILIFVATVPKKVTSDTDIHKHRRLASIRLSCAQLGWRRIRNDVCGESEVDGICYNDNSHSFQSAHQLCDGIGARLCTEDELNANVARGTGCLADYLTVWTQTPCTEKGMLGFPLRIFDYIY